jgi:hypothetical protein
LRAAAAIAITVIAGPAEIGPEASIITVLSAIATTTALPLSASLILARALGVDIGIRAILAQVRATAYLISAPLVDPRSSMM